MIIVKVIRACSNQNYCILKEASFPTYCGMDILQLCLMEVLSEIKQNKIYKPS